jgi:hypothetical protein
MTDPLGGNSLPDAIHQIQLGGPGDPVQSQTPSERGRAWAFVLSMDLSPAISAASDSVDWESLAKNVISLEFTQFLSRKMGNVSIRGIVIQFNINEIQTPAPNTLSVKGYVQLTKAVRNTEVKSWLPQCTWTMVRGGLHGSPAFTEYIEKQAPWITFEVVGKIGLNNAGRQKQKVNHKLCKFTLQNELVVPRWEPICIQQSKSKSQIN